MMNPFQFGVWVIVLTTIAYAIITQDVSVLSHFMAGVIASLFYLLGYSFEVEPYEEDEED